MSWTVKKNEQGIKHAENRLQVITHNKHIPAGRALRLEGAKRCRHDGVARISHGLFLRVVVLPLHATRVFLRL